MVCCLKIVARTGLIAMIDVISFYISSVYSLYIPLVFVLVALFVPALWGTWSSVNPAHSATSRYNALSLSRQRLRPSLALFVCCGLAMLVLSACGSSAKAGASSEELLAATQQIVQEYASSNDLASAQGEIAALQVANPNQWLLFAAETTLGDPNADPQLAAAFVKLTDALGLHSPTITQYAIDHQLPISTIASAQPGGDAPSQAQVQVAQTPTSTEAPPTATLAVATTTLTDASVVSNTVAVSATAPITDSQAAGTSPATATPNTTSDPQVLAVGPVNIRGGPGTNYDVVAAMQTGQRANVTAKSPDGAWWQINLENGQSGWVFGQLVQTSGAVEEVAVASAIPTPPTAAPQAAATVQQPTATAPAAAQPAPAPASGGPTFRLVSRRLWDVDENGGYLDGESVHCGEKRQLVVRVLDANDVALNGVAVQALYGAQETFVTGSQGKGDGTVEFILGEGQDVKVIRDSNGADVSSDIAAGLTTRPDSIDYITLIGARYCTDDATCRHFVEQFGCKGHFSWTVVFKRNY
jgi:uncharacterized protein YraI